MIIVRLVTLVVFLDVDNLGSFMPFVLLLLGLFFVAMFIVGLFMQERINEMRMEGLLLAIGMSITRVGMAISMVVIEIVGVCILVGVSMLSRGSLVRMGDLHPRFTQVTFKRMGPRFVAIGTVLAPLLTIFCA